MRKLSLLLSTLLLLTQTAHAADSKSFVIKVKVPETTYQVNALSSDGKVFAGKRKGKNVTITIPKKSLNGASLYATNSGQLVGPVYGNGGTKGLLTIVKKPTNPSKQEISTVTIKLNSQGTGQNYLMAKKLTDNFFNKKASYIPDNTPALGLNTVKGNALTVRGIASKATLSIDSDGDGVVNALDVDIDGDGISNLADASSNASNLREGEDSPVDLPFTALYLDQRESLNWHINGALTSSQLDAVIAGENKFSIAFFFTPEVGRTGITGGHIVCDPSLVYCKPTSGGTTGTGVYSGFSEGNQSIIGSLWSSITTDGSEYSLESLFGGQAFGASIQPRVGTTSFRPGDTYRADLTNSSRDIVESRSLTLPPYFVTAPAIKTYNVTSDSSVDDVTVNYANSNELGTSQGNPIVLASAGGFAGKLRLTYWRLQRLAIRPDETGGEYRDYGHLNYGVTISNNSGEYTCGGLYSNLSGTLTEVPSTGTGGSFRTSEGANIWPLVDGSGDFEPSNATDASTLETNVLSFTVDLASCLDRIGTAPGTYRISLLAAGVDTGHGANRGGQVIYVTIP